MRELVFAVILFLVIPNVFCESKKDFKGTGERHAAVSDCSNLPGVWTGYFQKPLYDEYDLGFRDSNPLTGVFSSVMIRGGGWTYGLGQLSDDNTTAVILFDSGVKLIGKVTANCTTITWDNNSEWKKKSDIDVVHIVFQNHLDVGYNGIPKVGFINNILNMYFTVYFPRAIAIAKAMRDLGLEERFIYTTHPFLLHHYLNCYSFQLAGIDLICPSSAEQQAMIDAVKRGDIYFHAATANMEYGNVYSAEMVDASLLLNQLLSIQLGVPPSNTVSIRDVPGTVRSLIPILLKQNITAITIGVNNYSPAPVLPSPSVWIEPNTNSKILYMQTGQGVGYPNNPGTMPTDPGGMAADNCVTFPGLGHAMCWAFRTDNSGPPESVDEVLLNFEIARWQFPGARVYASTYENFTTQLATVASQLPTSSSESGETWIVSDTADPVKMGYYRTASRAYIRCLNAGQCDPIKDERIYLFLRMLLKIPEHTYGLPTISDNQNYTNVQFHAARPILQTYKNSEASWIEQRDIALKVGFSYLRDHPLAATIQNDIQSLVPVVPDPAKSGYIEVPQRQWGKVYTVSRGSGSDVSIGLDTSTGALSTLVMNSVSWASPSNLLSKFIYRTYNDTDYNAQHIPGCCCCWGWSNMQIAAHPQQQKVSPTITSVYVSSISTTLSAPFSILVLANLDPALHINYGAPGQIWLNYTVNMDGTVGIELQLFQKTSTRLGEALFLDFTQVPQSGNWKWLVDVLGLPVDPLDVVTNGGVHQHGVKEGVVYTEVDGKGFFAVDTIDAAVVSPHTKVDEETSLLMPLTPLTGPVTGFSVILFQNAFNTNVPLYSFDDAWKFRFLLRAGV